MSHDHAFDYAFTTLRGGHVFAFEPERSSIRFYDMAHGLAMQCSYSGHLSGFYSTAQHSVYTAFLVRIWGGTRDAQREALLHDAHEAWVGDFPYTLNEAIWPKEPCSCRGRTIGEVMNAIDEQLAECFEVNLPADSPIVRRADRVARFAEAELLSCNSNHLKWPGWEDCAVEVEYLLRKNAESRELLRSLYPNEARQLFIDAARDLGFNVLYEKEGI